MNKIAVIHGPNLNLLGIREPEVYGSKSFKEVNLLIRNKAQELKIDVDIFQSNHEGKIVDHLQRIFEEIKGIIINPAGLGYYSIVLKDTLIAVKKPIIEVYISNIYQREEFRQQSVIAPISVGQISGLGPDGYLYALEAIVNIIKKGSY